MRGLWSWGRAHGPLVRGIGLWLVLAAPILYALAMPPYQHDLALRLVTGPLLLGLAVALNRRYPLVGLGAVLVGTWFDGNFVFALPVFSYLVGARMTRARPAVLAFAGVAVAGTGLNLLLLGTAPDTLFLAANVLLFGGVFPWLVGRYRRQQRELTLSGWRQAEALEREQRGAAERVRLRERARIAQDMHDSLGHELSLIALRAGALELAPDLDERHRAAAAELRASVADATERLRDIIGVLREDTAAGQAAPTRPADEDVAELIRRARDAGMVVRSSDGPTVGALPPLTSRAVHGVVREGLTNAARYAPGAQVAVTVASSGGGVEVAVVNPRPPAGPLPGAGTPPGAGSGLVALRERVRLAGGTLEAGPREGGFALLARLPLPGGASAHPSRAVSPVPPSSAVPVSPVPSSAVPVSPADLAATGPAAAGGGPVVEGGLRDARRRVRRSLLVAVTAPVLLAAMLSLVYYPYVTTNAVLEQSAYDGMRVGQPRADLVGLPGRQVEPVGTGAAAPSGATCEYYTDGNFPLAQATYRLCFADGRLVDKEQFGG
ncbi:sensor histidine kinase [Plantactinospora sp. GCM10030261]|uniref:sensor histidine kinase n=1 Tax=Plantactinospora sp. GCM10030261 TaxID=3273420 RepID=UPI0036100075